VLGRHGVVAEHQVAHPRDPDNPAGASVRAEILTALSLTQSLAPVERRKVAS
jgi:hypothetical protein